MIPASWSPPCPKSEWRARESNPVSGIMSAVSAPTESPDSGTLPHYAMIGNTAGHPPSGAIGSPAMGDAFSWLFNEQNMLRLAWANLVVSLVGLPITLVLTDEPPFILALSWWAITVTALGHISAARASKTLVESGD